MRNSDQINAVVDANRQRLLEMTAKVGVLTLADNHEFPEAVAGMLAEYVNGDYIKDIQPIREDKEIEALLAPAVSLTEPSTSSSVAPAASSSFAQPQDSVAEVAFEDDSKNRSDDRSRGLCCVIV